MERSLDSSSQQTTDGREGKEMGWAVVFNILG